MNNNVFESYPLISTKAIINLALRNEFEVSYQRGDYTCIMNSTPQDDNNSTFLVTCPNDDWKPNYDNFIVNGRIFLKNPNQLFNEFKIAEDDSIIGVAVRAYSKDSKINITKHIGEFQKSDEDLSNSYISFGYDLFYKKSELSEKLVIEIFLYLKKSTNKDTILAKESGANLGQLYSYELIIEGNGSLFPIKLFADKSKPLWTMSISYEGLDDELSSKCICLKINTLHKDFRILGSNDINKDNVYLWKEILAEFFENLFVSIEATDLNTICESSDLIDGSVGKFLQSLLQIFKINKSDVENNIPGLSEKIRLSLDDLLKWS